MAPRVTAEERLARLAAVADATRLTVEHLGELRTALLGACNLTAAKAAQIAAGRGLHELGDALITGFEHFLEDSAKRDKLCRAKIEMAKALNALELPAGTVLQSGARLVQMEPVYGGRVDTAAPLRAECALGLARLGHPGTLEVLTDLLVDPEPMPRAAAARALGAMGGQAGALLLRLKIRVGDRDPEVLGECFTALLTVDREGGVPLVAGFLETDDAGLLAAAALALGEAGGEPGAAVLVECWQRRVRDTDRADLVVPLALTRRDDARDLLVEALRSGPRTLACRALDGLRLMSRGAAAVAALGTIVRARRDPALDQAFAEAFPPARPAD